MIGCLLVLVMIAGVVWSYLWFTEAIQGTALRKVAVERPGGVSFQDGSVGPPRKSWDYKEYKLSVGGRVIRLLPSVLIAASALGIGVVIIRSAIQQRKK